MELAIARAQPGLEIGSCLSFGDDHWEITGYTPDGRYWVVLRGPGHVFAYRGPVCKGKLPPI